MSAAAEAQRIAAAAAEQARQAAHAAVEAQRIATEDLARLTAMTSAHLRRPQ